MKAELLRPDSELARQHNAHLERVKRGFAGEGKLRRPLPKPEVAVAPPDRTMRLATFEPPVRVLAEPMPTPIVEAPPLAIVTKSLAGAAPPPLLIRKPSVELILRVGCQHFGLTRSEVIADRRTQPLVRWRQIMFYVAKVKTERSFPDIGRRMGGRDHTTVLHAVRTIEAMIESGDAVIINHVNAVIAGVDAAMARQHASEFGASEEANQDQPMEECNGTSCDAV